ncbi:uncharacterized protein EV154DRAFT_553385, partial [Mucor mucedo]|uniref:uncharacterized protein n=1 Tax=Mucor mucedo TaxID=29922 RepID=UPI00221E87CA
MGLSKSKKRKIEEANIREKWLCAAMEEKERREEELRRFRPLRIPVHNRSSLNDIAPEIAAPETTAPEITSDVIATTTDENNNDPDFPDDFNVEMLVPGAEYHDCGDYQDDECEVRIPTEHQPVVPVIDSEIESITTQPVTTKTVPRKKTAYRLKLEKCQMRWQTLMKALPASYLSYLGEKGSMPDMMDVTPGPRMSCESSSAYLEIVEVDLYFVSGVQKKQKFPYCISCQSLPVALVKSGMFPLSPFKPKGALHFSLCNMFIELRNIFAGSGEKIAEFYGRWAAGTEKTNLSGESCSNVILMYNKMVELSEQLVMEDVSTSCPACPEVNSNDVKDKQFMMMDGNFRLKCRKSLADHDDVPKITGLDGFKKFWMDRDLIKKYDKSEQNTATTTTNTTTNNNNNNN